MQHFKPEKYTALSRDNISTNSWGELKEIKHTCGRPMSGFALSLQSPHRQAYKCLKEAQETSPAYQYKKYEQHFFQKHGCVLVNNQKMTMHNFKPENILNPQEITYQVTVGVS